MLETDWRQNLACYLFLATAALGLAGTESAREELLRRLLEGIDVPQHQGAAAGPLARLDQGAHLGMGLAGAGMEALPHQLSIGIQHQEALKRLELSPAGVCVWIRGAADARAHQQGVEALLQLRSR